MDNLNYEEVHQLSILEPERVWDHYAKDVIWDKPYTSTLEERKSIHPKWFVGGELNMSYNCLDRQVEEGYGDDVAAIYECPLTKTIEKITYKTLLKSVELLAGVMVQRCGLVKGDRVLFYLPMIPQCLTGMYACSRIGAIHTFIDAGFGYKEIAMRIRHFKPKLIITSNVGGPSNAYADFKSKVDAAIKQSGFSPNFCIVYNFSNHGKAKMNASIDLDWDEEISKAKPQGPIPVESDHPLHINYTSGTTGDPKGLVIPTGGAAVVHKFSTKYIYGLEPHETIFVNSGFSWTLGSCVMTNGPLLTRNPTILYEGSPSNRNDFLEYIRILNEHKVVSLTCTPTTLRTMMKHCLPEDFVMTHKILKGIHLAGEPCHSSLIDWTKKTFKCPVYPVWGQTELCAIGISPCLGYTRSPRQDPYELKSVLVPGIQGKIIDKALGTELPDGTIGRFLIKLPLFPVRSLTLFGNDERYSEIYFKEHPGYYDTMDCAVAFGNNVNVISRDDNDIQVGSTRINGYAVEEACLLDESIEQAAVVALEDSILAFVPFGFLVPKDYNNFNEKEIVEKAVKNVFDKFGALSDFRKLVVVPELPKNNNGKLIRGPLEPMLNGRESKMPVMIENPGVLQTIYDILCRAGYHPRLPTVE